MVVLSILFFLLLLGKSNADFLQENIARQGTATQSETYNYMGNYKLVEASRAIDGIKHGKDINGEVDFTHTKTTGSTAWWLLTLPTVYPIRQIKVFNRILQPQRLSGVKIWVGVGLTGGNYDGAELIGTITYQSGTNPYVFSNLHASGSSVQIQGGADYLSLAEVEVYVPFTDKGE
ncbi:hypothetical protein ACHWQZ_G011229 [Mnemiopsis leidyi]